MKMLLAIGLAGFAGTILRYLSMRAVDHVFPGGFPWGTLAVNIIGAFLAGFCFVWFWSRFQAYSEYFPVFFIGFLGAFTTFSTFALESVRFLFDAQYAKFIWNVVLQNVTGLLAAGGGFWLARICLK